MEKFFLRLKGMNIGKENDKTFEKKGVSKDCKNEP